MDKTDTKRTLHIVVAAGSGNRFGSVLPKQFCDLNGRPVLMTTIERLRACGGDILVVISRDFVDDWLGMCRRHGFESPAVTEGGATRWHSVANALATADASHYDVITVHDGARPVVDRATVDRVVKAIHDGADGAIPVIALTDSIRIIADDGTSHSVDRSRLRAVQTPQAFNGSRLAEAYSHPYSPAFTDDASVMEASGFTDLRLVDGSPRNIKITYPGDIAVAKINLSAE